MKLVSQAFALGLLLFSSAGFAVDAPISCTEVAATETKCAEYDTTQKACDAEVDAGIKAKTDKAKTATDECKKKHGVGYMLKCKKELKESTAAVNSPRQLAAGPVQKELLAKPDSACAKAEALGKATSVCRSPKAVLDAMKRNCIK